MNHDITLTLNLLEQAAWGLRFRLDVHNCAAVRLLFPIPDITDLRFGSVTTTQVAEWYTGLLVSASGSVVTLEPDESHAFEFRVRPTSVERPDSWDEGYDYYRWAVELPPGEYLVWYQWEVDAGYFEPDSHMRLGDLRYYADQEQAVAWQGRALSNRVQVIV